jgi:hypothetical protein
MSTEIQQLPPAPDLKTGDPDDPTIFGRCPVCKKPLRPRDLVTGEPKAPLVGAGKLSRALCTGCGNIIEYIGDGKWKLSNPN